MPLEAEGLERAKHLIRAPRHHARRIEIFDSQQPVRAVCARIEIAADRGEQRAEMQGTGGRGREAASLRLDVRALGQISRCDQR